jgi:hypothetical protein
MLLAFLLLGVMGAGCNAEPCQGAACVAPDAGPRPDAGFVASSIVFVPENQGAPGRVWLSLAEARPHENRFTLHVYGAGMPAYGVAGRLAFDPSLATLTGGAAGSALHGEGVILQGAAAATEKGGVFGVSRSVVFDASADLTPDRPIAILELTVSKPGHTRIVFDPRRSRVLDHGLKPVPVAHWLGGALIVE